MKIFGYEIRSSPYRAEDKFYYNPIEDNGVYKPDEKPSLIADYNLCKRDFPTLNPQIYILYEEQVTWGL